LVDVQVLGPAQVRRAGAPVDLGPRKQRALLAALALHAGRPVPFDTVIDLLWGATPPPGVLATLHTYVAGLRKALEPDRASRAPSIVLPTIGSGYALQLGPEALDATCFSRDVDREHRRLGPLNGFTMTPGDDLDADTLADVMARLDETLDRWHGIPYAELDDAPSALAERTRLGELRMLALEDRAVAALALGEHASVAAELEVLTAEHPLRERLWGLRAVALTRAGRQAEALDVLREVANVLDTELGLEPGKELRDLQVAVLRQDPALTWSPRVAKVATVASTPFTAGGWPLVGRDDQLAALVGLLDAREPVFAALTGEPGIGKSRLAAELGAAARSRGTSVVVGRCSQDEGAPPLWPWTQVLRALDEELPAADADDEGAAFRVWEEICATIGRAADNCELVIVLEDLHWADPSSLRVLRLLTETPSACRLVVIATWRPHPEPTGALAEVAEAFARHHALRLELTGLEATEASRVVQAIAHTAPTDEQAEALRARTDGNPFFLVEYARLAAERGDLGSLLAEDDPPTAVNEVLTRRLSVLPEPTLAALRTAAVIGRRFSGTLLADAEDLDPDAVLDVVEPALAAGLVRETTVDSYAFAHALVRDSVYLALQASRRARVHVRVAQALETRVGQESGVAQHWLAAGPGHAGRAWRAAVVAADLARGLHAHDESARLLTAALSSMSQDAAATAQDRLGVLMSLIDACRWVPLWPELVAATQDAIALAEQIGDVELVAAAATAPTVGALWQSAPQGEVNSTTVEALRWCLTRLEPGATRCRVMLSLANELYFGSDYDERRQLVDDAMAMARGIGDDRLMLDAYQIGFQALWCSRTAPERLVWVDQAIAIADRIGAHREHVVCMTLRATTCGELGLVDELAEAAATARRGAIRRRLAYGLLVLASLELPWRAMAGRFDACTELIAEIEQAGSQMTLEAAADARSDASMVMALWQGEGAQVAPLLAGIEGGPLPITATVISYFLRGGDADGARAHYEKYAIDLEHETWFSMLCWCNAAEVAVAMDDAGLGARVYAKLEPYAGRNCSAGSGNALGPVDAFLGLAARAQGDSVLAADHADRALALMDAWQIPLASSWLQDQRTTYAF
jgi:DNA-binding SARP family transcriptional activator